MNYQDFDKQHPTSDRVTEHGQDWLICGPCGAIASIVETEDGEDIELIEHGDGSCLDRCLN